MSDPAARSTQAPHCAVEPTGETASGPCAFRPAYEVAGGPEHFLVSRANGAYLFDPAGEQYIDLCMGYGALVLGHNAAAVKEALRQQLDQGWMFGFAHAQLETLAALICAAGAANARAVICNSESDATLLALRAARAFTGRDRIAVFAGAHHGLHDFALVTEAPRRGAANDGGRKAHVGAGIPGAVDDYVCVLPYGETAALEWVRAYGGQLAAVIVEPLSSQAPSLAHGAWLRELQAMCRATGACFVLDEAMTGFRLAFGGAQECFGLAPDLVTYGIAMGGGLPIGAVAGQTAVMAAFDTTERDRRVFSGAPHAGNPLSAAAAVAVLSLLADHGHTVFPKLNDAATTLTDAFNEAAVALDAPARMSTAGSMFRILFDGLSREERSARLERGFYRALFQRKVVVHASKRCFLSTAHTVADITTLSTALIDSLKEAIS